ISVLSTAIPADQIEIENGQIALKSHLDEAADLNRMLIEQGVTVTGMQTQTDGLEQYFMKRIGK
ncbi:MAG: hypothetical protein K2O73_03410, partial [Lachnospiraceae bacterium]|nr:hypothetical protein [Lachnospiraceae bacterium]